MRQRALRRQAEGPSDDEGLGSVEPVAQPPRPDRQNGIFSDVTTGVTAATGKRVGLFDNVSLDGLNMLSDALINSVEDEMGQRSVSPLELWANDILTDDETIDDCRPVSMSDFGGDSQPTSDMVSSVSMTSSVSRRPSRSAYVNENLSLQKIEEALKQKCKCVRRNGSSCHSSFSFGDICNLRYKRAKMDTTADHNLRVSELTSLLANPDRKIAVGGDGILSRMCCLTSYRIAYALGKSSVYRIVQQLVNEMPPGVIGRSKKSATDRVDDMELGPLSAKQLHVQAWLKAWLDEEGDVDPTGNEQNYTIDMVEVVDVHKEYLSEWRVNALTSGDNGISLRDFTRVWDHVMKSMRVRIREKKNMTTKCDGKSFLDEFLTHCALIPNFLDRQCVRS